LRDLSNADHHTTDADDNGIISPNQTVPASLKQENQKWKSVDFADSPGLILPKNISSKGKGSSS
jgi:hypothetical protein